MDFFSSCEQVTSFLRISLHLKMEALMRNFIVLFIEIFFKYTWWSWTSSYCI